MASSSNKTNVHFSNLPRELEPEELLDSVRKFGTPTSHSFPKDWLGSKRNFAFINFSTASEAQAVVSALNNHEVRPGRRISVDLAFQNEGGDMKPRQRLFARNLPLNVTADQLREVFGRYGQLVEVLPLFNSKTNTGKGAGFLRFEAVEEAQAALEACNGQVLFPEDGQAVQVCYADPQHKRVERDKLNRMRHSQHSQQCGLPAYDARTAPIFVNPGMPHNVMVGGPMYQQPMAMPFAPQHVPLMAQTQPTTVLIAPMPQQQTNQNQENHAMYNNTPPAVPMSPSAGAVPASLPPIHGDLVMLGSITAQQAVTAARQFDAVVNCVVLEKQGVIMRLANAAQHVSVAQRLNGAVLTDGSALQVGLYGGPH